MKFVSALITQGSGVMGNLVVERNGVIRTRNAPANPNTARQQAARALVAFYAAAWSSVLTAVQRSGWNTYAGTVKRNDALGKPKKLSGIDMYVGANAALVTAGQDDVSNRPTDDGSLPLPAVTGAVLDDSANTLALTFAAAVPAGTFVTLFMSPHSISLGRSRYTGPYRRSSTQEGADATTVTFTGLTVPVTGEQWAWRISAVNAAGQTAIQQGGLTLVVA